MLEEISNMSLISSLHFSYLLVCFSSSNIVSLRYSNTTMPCAFVKMKFLQSSPTSGGNEMVSERTYAQLPSRSPGIRFADRLIFRDQRSNGRYNKKSTFHFGTTRRKCHGETLGGSFHKKTISKIKWPYTDEYEDLYIPSDPTYESRHHTIAEKR